MLAACLAIAFAPGATGVLFPPGAWYAQLAKSPLTPPGSVFPIAWTLLYATMGVALFELLRNTVRGQRRGPLALFAVQLALNAAWSWIFFGLHAPAAALVEIACLWVAIAAAALAFARHSRLAGALLLPYLAWVGFATYLTWAIVRAN
ncbi:MAG: tryptophan-rich sensory protein [Deltaproteobacteria bacterium]|nr:tryptophan-rich sensory protein [Deltaproteobacteria bacterium]